MPNLKENQIVIIDNAHIHNKVRNAIGKAGCSLPASALARLNPIEHFWSHLKNRSVKTKTRIHFWRCSVCISKLKGVRLLNSKQLLAMNSPAFVQSAVTPSVITHWTATSHAFTGLGVSWAPFCACDSVAPALGSAIVHIYFFITIFLAYHKFRNEFIWNHN